MSLHQNTDSDLWVSWQQYNELIERLALQIHESGWKFDKIVCVQGLHTNIMIEAIDNIYIATNFMGIHF